MKLYIKKMILENQNQQEDDSQTDNSSAQQENNQNEIDNQQIDPMTIVQKSLKEKLQNMKYNMEESLLIAKEKHFNIPKFKPNKVINQNSDIYKSGVDDNRGIKQVFHGQERAANGNNQLTENSNFGHVSNKQSKLSDTTEAIKNKLKSAQSNFSNPTTYHDRTISSPNGGTPRMKDGQRHLLQVDREKAYRDAKYYNENPNGPSPKYN